MAPTLSIGPHIDVIGREIADLNDHVDRMLQLVKTHATGTEGGKRPSSPVNTDVSGWCGGSAYDY